MEALRWTPVAALPLVSTLLFFWIGICSWRYRSQIAGRSFLLFVVVATIWTLGYTFELCSTTLGMDLTWATFQYLGIPFLSPLILCFSLELGRDTPARLVRISSLCLAGTVSLLAITDRWHHLLRVSPRMVDEPGYRYLAFDRGPVFYTNIGLAYACLLISGIVLARMAYAGGGLRQRQARLLLASLALPMGGNVARLVGWAPQPGVDPTPALFAFSACILVFGLFRQSLVAIVPIARSKVVDELADAIVVTGPSGDVIDCNPAALRILGKASASKLSESPHFEEVVRQFPPPDEVRAHSHKLLQLADRTYLVRRSEVDAESRPGGGHLYQLTDLTEQRRAEESLRAAKEAAEEANAAKSRFVATMSHELRTPLHGVLGISELLGNTALSLSQIEYLNGIRQSATLLKGLIDDVLELSEIDAEAVPVEERPTEIEAVVREIVLTQRSLLSESVQLHFSVEGVPKFVLADEMRLKRILTNVVGNAVKFTSLGRIDVSVCRIRSEIEITVVDTGIGIPEIAQENVFSPFVLVDDSTTRRAGGSGLGLPLTKALVEKLGGTIELQSREGEGTTARIRLPFRPVERVSNAAETPLVTPRGLRILVAEDNPVNAMVISRLLTNIGCLPTVRPDGKSMLEAFGEEDYDIVIVDLHMPVMDGFSACRAIRERYPERNVPIYALTASALAEDRRRAAGAGMNGYLTKPVRSRDLVAMLSGELI